MTKYVLFGAALGCMFGSSIGIVVFTTRWFSGSTEPNVLYALIYLTFFIFAFHVARRVGRWLSTTSQC